jgi:glucosylceramidase
MFSCSESPLELKWVSSDPEAAFVTRENLKSAELLDGEPIDVIVSPENTRQVVDGFGACFNELGWTSLSLLSDEDRAEIIRDLFSEDGMNFTLCRMPIGANDFSRDWYSYNETDGDFEMAYFSIDNDREALIPFIKAALQVNPYLKLWASPWCPPTWMKTNGKYACQYKSAEEFLDFVGRLTDTNITIEHFNDLTAADMGAEGTDMFIQNPGYMKAYALYFRKFIEAYRTEGITIGMVAPQNEFNSCQVFPSCTWTPQGLHTFICQYLGPEMKKIGVDVMLGTMERENNRLVDTILQGDALQYVSSIGFQWAGKQAIAKVASKFPKMKLMQTESECGDGTNTWKFCMYTWNQMRNCFNDGISSYMYWNISLEKNALSHWLWRQNSLVSVNTENGTYRYTPEYYLMKHFSHFVKPGAKRIAIQGRYDNALAFVNPDDEIVVLIANDKDNTKTLTLSIRGKTFTICVSPGSVNTFIF